VSESNSESTNQMFGVLLTLAYRGTNYAGWAPQINAPTVYTAVLKAIKTMNPRVMDLRGSSRTDAGVHAFGQRAAFESDRNISSRGWVLGLRRVLPEDIIVRSASRVEPGFVPRFHSYRKRYIYTFLIDPVGDPFVGPTAMRIFEPLDFNAMKAEAACLVGTHDFAAFRAGADIRINTVRTITRCEFLQDRDPRVLRLIVEGNAFLYNMIRIIAGTLVDVGLHQLPPGTINQGIQSKRRIDLGRTAPAHGLLLERVYLKDEGTDSWPTQSPQALLYTIGAV
jgi:tRNA pseudouridine38-40 synthase